MALKPEEFAKDLLIPIHEKITSNLGKNLDTLRQENSLISNLVINIIDKGDVNTLLKIKDNICDEKSEAKLVSFALPPSTLYSLKDLQPITKRKSK